jgi:hypothetical protein
MHNLKRMNYCHYDIFFYPLDEDEDIRIIRGFKTEQVDEIEYR